MLCHLLKLLSRFIGRLCTVFSDGIPYTSIGLTENLVMVVVVVVVCVRVCMGGGGYDLS